MSDVILQRCLSNYKCAKSDNERFAALLLITKFVKAERSTPEERHEVFETIGFTFIRRLLKSKQVLEGCSSDMFRNMAVTILACFCTDQSLVTHTEMLAEVPTLIQIISSSRNEDVSTEVIDDCYQCLFAIFFTEEGRDAMLKNEIVSCICEAIVSHETGNTKAMQLLLAFIETFKERTWIDNVQYLHKVLDHISNSFMVRNDASKFELCQSLTVILSSSTKTQLQSVFKQAWMSNIHCGLSDILRSRIGEQEREPALTLAAITIDMLGVPWALESSRDDNKFILILIHLTCIEVRMTIETLELEEINSKSNLLSSCYSLLENIISYMTVGPSMDLNDKEVLQLHSAMKGALNAVLFLLNKLEENRMWKQYPQLVTATVRVLGSWIAEETSALKKEVCELLPLLLLVINDNFEEIQKSSNKTDENTLNNADIMRFLLPGVCHLSTEDNSRKVLLDNDMHVLMARYLSFQWTKLKNIPDHSEAEAALIMVSNVFMNIAVLEESLVKEHPLFMEILQLLLSSVPNLEIESKRLPLIANMTVLCLMLLRHLSSKKPTLSEINKFLSSVIEFLRDAFIFKTDVGLSLSDEYQPVWDDISYLWHLAMQVFASCLNLYPYSCTLVLKSGWIPQLLNMLHKSPDPIEEIITSYSGLLTELCKVDKSAEIIIREKGGLDIARKFRMTSLEKELVSKSK